MLFAGDAPVKSIVIATIAMATAAVAMTTAIRTTTNRQRCEQAPVDTST